jgi:hypothetical protein
MIYSFLVFIILAESTSGYVARNNRYNRPADISSQSQFRKGSPSILAAGRCSILEQSSSSGSLGMSSSGSNSQSISSSSSSSSGSRKLFALNCIPSGSDEIEITTKKIETGDLVDNKIDNTTTGNVINKMHMEEPHLMPSDPMIAQSLYMNPKAIEQKVIEEKEKEAALYSSLNPKGMNKRIGMNIRLYI